MSVHQEDNRKVTTHRLIEMKQRGEKIAMLTAYDYSMAKLIDQAGMDIILVGDSASNVMAGNVTTLPITLNQMIYHGSSVTKAVSRALVVVDMPFGTCSGNPTESLNAAIRIMKETGADALKVEGGKEIVDDIRKIIDAGIPVMGHLGLMPSPSTNTAPTPSVPKTRQKPKSSTKMHSYWRKQAASVLSWKKYRPPLAAR